MVRRVNCGQHPREAEEKAQPDVTTTARKLGEDQAATAGPLGLRLDRDAATSSPRRIRAPPSASAANNSPLKAAGSARNAAGGPSIQLEPPTDQRPQLDAAAAVFASLPRPDDARSAVGFVRPAPICTNPSGISPSQDRPRGWQAMLQSPTQPDDQIMLDVDQQLLQLSPAEPEQHQQQPLPVLSPAADDNSSDAAPQFISSSSTAAAAAGVNAGGPSRPSPLILPDSSNSNGITGSRFGSTASPASRFSALRIASPASSSASAAAAAFRPYPMARPDLRILPPPSPSDAGCITPTALQSPSRLYSGPPITEADVDYDLIDGIVGADSSNNPVSNSSSSSPNLSAAAGSAVYTRSGGLRSSRDTDLRRMAMTNQLLHSPRPPVLAITGSGPQPMFTGDTRARALNSNTSSSTATPTATEGSSELMSAAAAVAGGEAGSPALVPSETPPPHAVQLQRLYQQTLRSSQGSSPASAASPAAASILATTSSSTRSLPATPSTLQHRSCSTAAAPGSSRSSSMSASPVPPPSHGPAAALLAGAVGASPRTPRSPLSVMYSPYSGRIIQGAAGAGTPLPLPLFMMNSGGTCSASGSPMAAGATGSAGLPPSGRSSFSNIGASGLFSPPHLSSRLRQENSGLLLSSQDAAAAAVAVDETADHMDEDDNPHLSQQQHQQQQEDAAAADSSYPAGQQGVTLPEHYPQVLRQRLQVTDTRYGPHGGSPLSPSHHAHLQQIQQQQQQQGPNESLLSPTRPTPLVQPALAAAAGEPDAAAAAAATAAGRLVGDVGRRDVHEWLDQHSWSFLYELPHNLRDAADFARNQRRSSRSIASVDAAAAVSEGHMPAQQQQQGLAVLDGTASDWFSSVSELQQVLGYQEAGRDGSFNTVMQQQQQQQATPVPQGLQAMGRHTSRITDTAGGTAAAGSSIPLAAVNRSRPLDWAFGGLRVSVDQSGPGPTVSNLSSNASSSSSSRLGPLYPHGGLAVHVHNALSSNLGGSANSSSSYHGRLAPSSGGFRHSTGSMGDHHHSCPVADASCAHRGFQVVADSRLTNQQQVALSGLAAENTAAGSSSRIPETLANSTRASSSSSNGSARLLCPGSHRYLPGSPVVQHSCCCSCPPATRTFEDPQTSAAAAGTAAAAAAAAVAAKDGDDTVCGSITNSAAAAAELLRSSMAAVAAAAAAGGDHVKTSDGGSRVMQDTSSSSSRQRGRNPPLSIVAAGESFAVELSPATPALHTVERLMSAGGPGTRQQPLRPSTVEGSAAAAAAEQQTVLLKQAGAAAAGSAAGPRRPCACPACSSSRNLETAAAAGATAAECGSEALATGTSAAQLSLDANEISTGGMMSLICGQILQQQQQQQQQEEEEVCLEKLSTTAEVQTLDSKSVLLSLLHDEQYMHALLSALPEVDPWAPVVQEAVQQLRELLQQQRSIDLAGL